MKKKNKIAIAQIQVFGSFVGFLTHKATQPLQLHRQNVCVCHRRILHSFLADFFFFNENAGPAAIPWDSADFVGKLLNLAVFSGKKKYPGTPNSQTYF